MDFRTVKVTLFLFLFIWPLCATAQVLESVWPKNKITYSDSLLPGVVQVLTYLMERIEGVDVAPKVTDGEEEESHLPPIMDENSDSEVTGNKSPAPPAGAMPGVAAGLRPTVAFILLGRLRDTLAHEAKRQGFSRIQGFSPAALDVLAASGDGVGGALEQLRSLLSAMVRNGNAKRRDSLAQSGLVADHLAKKEGPLRDALALLPPLKYSHASTDDE